jgi:hypothetical protein
MKSAGKFALGFSAKPQVRQKCDYRGQRAATSDQPRALDFLDRSTALPGHTIESVGDSRAARSVVGESRDKQHEGFHIPSGLELAEVNRVKPRITD